MHSRLVSRIGLLALVTGAVGSSGGMVGCAQERDPISREQLHAIPKSFLVGAQYENPIDDPEFYARTMVIDVPYGESSSGSWKRVPRRRRQRLTNVCGRDFHAGAVGPAGNAKAT